MRDGWHEVDSKTDIAVLDGRIIRVRTTRHDLDAALDAAAQFWGEPLEMTGEWLNARGSRPKAEDGRDTQVVCKVSTAADVHGDKS